MLTLPIPTALLVVYSMAGKRTAKAEAKANVEEKEAPVINAQNRTGHGTQFL